MVEKSVKTPYHIFYLKKVKQTKTFFCGSNEQKSFYQKVEKNWKIWRQKIQKITFLSGFAQNLKRQQEIFFEQNRGEEGLSHKALITKLHRLAIRKQKIK